MRSLLPACWADLPWVRPVTTQATPSPAPHVSSRSTPSPGHRQACAIAGGALVALRTSRSRAGFSSRRDAGLSSPPLSAGPVEGGGVATAATELTSEARRAKRRSEYNEMKRGSLVDAAVLGLLGAGFAFLSAGPATAQGLFLGTVAGSVYLTFLHRDVDSLAPGRTPLDLLNPFRFLRLLSPLFLVLVLALQTAFATGVDEWLAGLSWEPGRNFVGFVSPPALFYGAMLGYVLPVLALQIRGLAQAVPEARDLVSALPGSVGIAVKLSQEADKQSKGPAAKPMDPSAKVVPVLLVSGPRGCGKTSLVKRLKEQDKRFSEPEWVATGAGTAAGKQQVVSEAEFEGLQESEGLAVSYEPYGEDGEQVNIGLPVIAVPIAAAETGACVLDVDPPTARTLLAHDWDKSLGKVFPEEKMQLRVVTVWVTLTSLDNIVERNKERLQDSLDLKTTAAIERQVAPLRSQATSDIEWALTSGNFDFTVINESVDEAAAEVTRAAKYCFDDE